MSKSGKSFNENYRHECETELVEIPSVGMNQLFDSSFSMNELAELFDFYLVHTPVKRDEKAKDGNNRWLGDYGWKGGAELSKLESSLLKTSGISSFVILKSDCIDSTLAAMKFTGKICPSCPRAVFKLNCKINLKEDGGVNVTPSESRLACVFRHIRNAMAHGQVYGLGNQMIYMFDKDDDGKNSAALVIKQKTLFDWIRVVDKNGAFYSDGANGRE